MSTSQALKALLMQTGSASAAWIARSLDVGEDAVMQAARCCDSDLTITANGISRVFPLKVSPSMPYFKSLKTGKGKLTIQSEDMKSIGISGYEVAYRVKGTKKWKIVKYGPNSPKLVLKKVSKGKRYNVKIRAFYNSPKGGRLDGGYSMVRTSKKVK